MEGKVLLLTFTPSSDRRLGGEEGWWEQWQFGQSYQAIYNVEVAKTQPIALYGVVNASVAMNTWMNEKGEGCVFKMGHLVFRGFAANLSTCYLSSWRERFRNVQRIQAIWVFLENPESISELTYVLTFSNKYIQRWLATNGYFHSEV